MLGEFSVGTMDAVAGLAAQLDLSTGLQCNLGVAARERDDMPVLFLRLPSESLDQLAQNEFHTPPTGVGNRSRAASIDADFFVLRTNPPTVAGLTRVMKVGFELLFFFNDQHENEYDLNREDGSLPFPL